MKTKIKKIILSSAVIVMFITAADFNQGPVDKSPVEKYSRVKVSVNTAGIMITDGEIIQDQAMTPVRKHTEDLQQVQSLKLRR